MDEAHEANDPCTGDQEEARIHVCFLLAGLTIGVQRTRAALARVAVRWNDGLGGCFNSLFWLGTIPPFDFLVARAEPLEGPNQIEEASPDTFQELHRNGHVLDAVLSVVAPIF